MTEYQTFQGKGGSRQQRSCQYLSNLAILANTVNYLQSILTLPQAVCIG